MVIPFFLLWFLSCPFVYAYALIACGPVSCGYAQLFPFRARWAHNSEQPLVASAPTPACRA